MDDVKALAARDGHRLSISYLPLTRRASSSAPRVKKLTVEMFAKRLTNKRSDVKRSSQTVVELFME